jgi:hypothetical protein
MIEYVLAVVILATAIILLFGLGKPRKKGPRTLKDHSHDYHGVYSHDSHSVDTELYFPVLKDSSSVFPMNKREERKKTETYQNRQ